MHMPLVLTNRRRRGGSASAPAFSPTSLYSSGSQGIWLDPSDLSTMFSDRAGTTPVTTPGTVVGLRLDKSKGLVLGSELVVNGDFSSATGWTVGAGWTISGGVATRVSDTVASGVSRSISPTAGVSYQVTYTITSYTSGNFLVRFTGGTTVNGTTRVGTGTFTEIIVAATGNNTVDCRMASGSGALVIDNISVRELAGNHATAPTDAARPIYGVEPKGGRRNLLTWSEDFRTTAQAGETRPWLVDGTTITADFGTAPDGTVTADRMVTGAGGNTLKLLHQSLSLASGTHTFSMHVKDNGGSARAVDMFFATPTISAFAGASYNFDTDVLTNLAASAPFALVSSSRASVGSGWFRITIAVTVASAQTVRLYTGASYTAAQAGNYLIWGAQLELGSTATNYQRVLSAYDITEAGVATCHYVQYDGSDDSMSTAAIDFTATDKMSVFAGVRKLSDAAIGIVAELSADWFTNNGSIALASPNTVAANFGWNSRGSLFVIGTTSNSFPAPTTQVLSGVSSISEDILRLRQNGVQTLNVTSDQGTGNYGNYPLFLGRRNNATLPFNGKDYGIIIVGKATSSTEITATELWLSDKTAEVDIPKSISPNIYTRSGDTILDRANSIIERRTV